MAIKIIDEDTPTGVIKAGFYGESGFGKTVTALSFPKPFVIDGDDGSLIYKLEKKFAVVQVRTLADTLEAIDELKRMLVKQPGRYETIIIDPVTVLRDNRREAVLGNKATATYRDHAAVNQSMKFFYNKLTGLGLHIIITAREMDMLEDRGGNLVKTGTKFDADKNFPYFFDFVLRMVKPEMQGNKKNAAQVLVAEVVKNRGRLLKVDEAGRIVSPSFDKDFKHIADALKGGTLKLDEIDEGEAIKRDAKNAGQIVPKEERPVPPATLRNASYARQWVAAWHEKGVDMDTLKGVLGDSEGPLTVFADWKGTVEEADARVMKYVEDTVAKVNGG